MRNIDDPCYRNGSDVNWKQQKNCYLRLLHHSRWAWNGLSLQELIYAKWLVFKQAKKSLINSRQTDPRVSAFDSLDIMSIRSLYCTLKTFNSTEDCFKTTLSKPCLSWSGFDTSSILKRLDDCCSKNGKVVDYKGRKRPLKYRWASYLHKQICERSYLFKLQESRWSTKA